MLGYWRDPERTRETLREGWLWTGDLGFVDEDGYLFLTDRKGDMIISGGENVHPTETENALQEHPAVREVAVIGLPDPKWGEAVKAVVALEPGRAASAEELIAFCRERIAGYKCPEVDRLRRGAAEIDGGQDPPEGCQEVVLGRPGARRLNAREPI